MNMNREQFYKTLNSDYKLVGRDDFYTHLLHQEIDWWLSNNFYYNDEISDEDIAYMIDRRGFNEEESTQFKNIVKFINENYSKTDEEKLEYFGQKMCEFISLDLNRLFEHNKDFFINHRETLGLILGNYILDYQFNNNESIDEECSVK